MSICRVLTVAGWLMYLIGPAWADGAATDSGALALAALVAENSPTLAATDKQAIASLFAGNANVSYPAGQKITVSADKIMCSASNVDLTQRSCELSFGAKTVTVTARKAHELFATIGEVGVQYQGAMGSVLESLTRLTCTVDPDTIKQKAGGGVACQFTPG